MFYAWGDDWEANEQLFWCQIITADSKTPHDAVRDATNHSLQTQSITTPSI